MKIALQMCVFKIIINLKIHKYYINFLINLRNKNNNKILKKMSQLNSPIKYIILI